MVDPFQPETDPLPVSSSSSANLDPRSDGAWVRFTPDGENARVLEVLAEADSPRCHLYRLASDVGISPQHPLDVYREAERLKSSPGIDDPDLEDLTHLPFVTIDEPTSKDLDQAVFVEKLPDGFRVWYAIADAAHFVRPGTALMDEALRRGSTFYMPGLVLSMLPTGLSEGIVSLNPRVDRRALVFRMELEADGIPRDTQLIRGRIHSRVKTSYQAVQRFYDGGSVPGVDNDSDLEAPVAKSLEALAEVGNARMRLADIRDTVRFQRRELKVELADGHDAGFVALEDPRLDSERYNEQISLLANVEGARLLARAAPGLDAVQPIFRFHQSPDRFRLERLQGRLNALVRRRKLPTDVWRWHPSRQSLADFVAGLPRDPASEPLRRAVHRQVLMAGGRSGFGTSPDIHYGVGAEAYARFTAPMREIVGVFVHKETWELLGEDLGPDPEADEALREQVVDAANRSRKIQRRLDSEINRVVIDDLFARGDAPWSATVMGFSRGKMHLQLDTAPIDVKVYLRHLEDHHGERLRPGRDGVTLRRADGRILWTLGDTVRVHAAGRDANDRWRLAVDP